MAGGIGKKLAQLKHQTRLADQNQGGSLQVTQQRVQQRNLSTCSQEPRYHTHQSKQSQEQGQQMDGIETSACLHGTACMHDKQWDESAGDAATKSRMLDKYAQKKPGMYMLIPHSTIQQFKY